jgi:hypothetical protein
MTGASVWFSPPLTDQGDVAIVDVAAAKSFLGDFRDTVPDDAVEIAAPAGVHVVAHSETGHHHYVRAADARFWGTSDPNVCYLQVTSEYAELVHDRSYDTHKTIRMPRGLYQINRQQQQTPQGWGRVID